MAEPHPLAAPVFLLGFSNDARALLDHLRVEAPELLAAVVVVDRDAGLVSRLQTLGVRHVCGDPTDLVTVLDAGVHQARIIVIFPEGRARHAGRRVDLARVLGRLCPGARIFTHATDGAAARLDTLGVSEVIIQ